MGLDRSRACLDEELFILNDQVMVHVLFIMNLPCTEITIQSKRLNKMWDVK